MINFQKIANKNTGIQFGQESNIKQKIEKKEMERLIQNQLLIKPDLSFEAEIKHKLELEKNKQKDEDIKRKASIFSKNILQLNTKKKSKNRMSNLVSRDMLKEIYKTKKYKSHIDNELSFMTDLSLSNLDNSLDDNKNDSALLDGSLSDDTFISKKKMFLFYQKIIQLYFIRNFL